VETSVFYMGFNMLDPVVAGTRSGAAAAPGHLHRHGLRGVHLHLRQRPGLPAQGPIPPGIFGYREGEAGINPYVYEWRDGRPVRRGIEEARRLMGEAGYPGGATRRRAVPLSINFEAVATGPDDKARLNWIRKQFAKLGIELVIRSTDYNRFQEKMRNGTGQVYMWGWNADYPDPENFLFLLYGPNGKVEHQGENASNYANPEFDALSSAMKYMDDGPERRPSSIRWWRSPGATPPGSGASTPSHSACTISGSTTPCPTRWPTTP
jgi:oligopeptide transport system substrate-binding protein